MHPLVRDLYKRVLLVGRDYPGGGARARCAGSGRRAVRVQARQQVAGSARPELTTPRRAGCCRGQAGWSKCGARPRSSSLRTATLLTKLSSSGPSPGAGIAPAPCARCCVSAFRRMRCICPIFPATGRLRGGSENRQTPRAWRCWRLPVGLACSLGPWCPGRRPESCLGCLGIRGGGSSWLAPSGHSCAGAGGGHTRVHARTGPCMHAIDSMPSPGGGWPSAAACTQRVYRRTRRPRRRHACGQSRCPCWPGPPYGIACVGANVCRQHSVTGSHGALTPRPPHRRPHRPRPPICPALPPWQMVRAQRADGRDSIQEVPRHAPPLFAV